MLTVADENMPFAVEAFSTLGDVRTAPGRAIGPADLQDADILAVRSVTGVNRALLAGSPVRFVGTATIGTDHVDTAWLERAGIGFAAAPGCNAVSVAEYVVAALFVLARRLGFSLKDKVLGIIGAGNVGSRVLTRVQALGLQVIANDPPLAERTGDPLYRPLEEALAADIISLHVPLTAQGPYPTQGMVDRAFLERLKPGAVLINTSRGPVVDSPALKSALDTGRLAAAVLDVWENEPEIDLELVQKAAIATAHIAGYSFDGKVNGTEMIYRAACSHFGRDAVWEPAGLLPAPAEPEIRPVGQGRTHESLLAGTVAAAYDILADDRRLRSIAEQAGQERGRYFDRLRREYPLRREFAAFTVEMKACPPALESALAGLGFRVKG